MRDALLARWLALPDNTRGAIWMLLAAAGFSSMSVFVKIAGEDLPAIQVAFFRCVFGFAFLMPALLRLGLRKSFATNRPGLHTFRAFIGMAAMLSFFYAIANAPLADVVALSFAKPLFVIGFAVLFLGEIVRWRRWTATGVGFLGVVVMMRPGQEGFDPDTLAALSGAAFVALAVVLVKLLSKTESHMSTMAWFAGVSSIATAIPAAIVWAPPTPELWAVGVMVGFLGVISQSFILSAYRTGEATAVAPFDYSRIIFATVLGAALFNEWPDAWTLSGAAIVVAATIYIGRREAKLGGAEETRQAEALNRKV